MFLSLTVVIILNLKFYEKHFSFNQRYLILKNGYQLKVLIRLFLFYSHILFVTIHSETDDFTISIQIKFPF